MSGLRLAPANIQQLVLLADSLARTPLMRSYGRDAAALHKSFTQATRQQGNRFYVAMPPLGDDAPLGLVWFVTRGAFANAAYLRLLMVVPGHLRQGVGSALLNTYEHMCDDGIRGYFLLCSKTNAPARAFYEARGYRQVGSLPDYVVRGMTEIIYFKARTASP